MIRGAGQAEADARLDAERRPLVGEHCEQLMRLLVAGVEVPQRPEITQGVLPLGNGDD